MFTKFRISLSKIIPVIILVILAFSYRDVLRSMVLVPLAYLIFVFRLAAIGIGQETLWISFVVLSTIIALISLAMRREVQTRETSVEHNYPSRLQNWLNNVSRKERSHYFKWNFAQDLSNLLIEAIAYQQGSSRQQVHHQILTGKIDLPPEILEYLQISQKPFAHTGLASPSKDNLLLKLWEKIITPRPKSMYNSPLDLEHETIVRYLEESLCFNAENWEG